MKVGGIFVKRVRSRKIKLHQEINDGYLEKFSYLFEENLELYMNYRYKIYSKKFEDFPSNILRGVTYAYRILIIDDFLQFLKKLGFDFSLYYDFYGSREDEICSKYFIEFSGFIFSIISTNGIFWEDSKALLTVILPSGEL